MSPHDGTGQLPAADEYGPGQYAAAVGLVERSAAAQVSAIPDQPADDGFFGPGSVAWRLSGDLSGVIAGLRALLLQALHPLAMAGVDQHSDWRRDPVGRLAATTAYTTTVTFGERAAVERAAGRVRRIHERVTGTDPVTGQAYAAGDPALLLWVHAALVDSAIAATDLFGAGLAAPDADRYVAEMAIAAELLGVPAGQVPRSTAELAAYLAPDAAGAALPPRPPGSPWPTCSTRPAWTPTSPRSGRTSATAPSPRSRPGRRDLYGYEAPPLTPARREEIRQALGVLDVGVPGRAGRAGGPAAGRRSGSAPPSAHEPRPPHRRRPGRRRRRRRAGRRRSSAAGSARSASPAACPPRPWSPGPAPATRAARRGCSPRPARAGSSSATISPCRPPRT